MSADFHAAFRSPGPEFRSAPFWAWNAAITREGVREQVPLFAAMGYGGFFIHSRPGLATPYLSEEWFARVRDAVEAAEKAGLKAWLYDEDRWPSGTAGGFLTRERPDHAATELRTVPGAEPGSAPEEGSVLAWFAVRRDPSAPGSLLGYRRLRSGVAVVNLSARRLGCFVKAFCAVDVFPERVSRVFFKGRRRLAKLRGALGAHRFRYGSEALRRRRHFGDAGAHCGVVFLDGSFAA